MNRSVRLCLSVLIAPLICAFVVPRVVWSDEPTETKQKSERTLEPTLNAETKVSGRVCVRLRRPDASMPLSSDFSVAKEQVDAQADASEKPSIAQDSGYPYVGREIADYRALGGDGRYLFEDEFGELRSFDADDVLSIEPAPEVALGDVRKAIAKKLLEEFGDEFNVKSTERYLFVYDTSEGYVDWCARLFESLEDGFRRFAVKNELNLKERVEPMIVVVFATKNEFVHYASQETAGADKIAAYYNMQTNRVALYDLSETEGTRYALSKRRRESLETREFLSRPNAAFNVATIVHEATHQIAFNRGLFLRFGPVALWSVEGLSLLFETPNGKASQGGWGYRSSFPTNERQLALFKNFAKTTQQRDPIRDLIRQDSFMNDVQGSYSTSWALFYYLYKKQPKELAKYLNELASKPPCVVYAPEERIADFEKYFGDDWDKLTQSLLRFVRRL